MKSRSRCITRFRRLAILALVVFVAFTAYEIATATLAYAFDVEVRARHLHFEVSGVPIPVADVLFLITMMVIGVLMLLDGIRLWRSVRRARRLDYLCCTACLYDLSRSAESGECPECGTEYRFEDLPATWDGVGFAIALPRWLRRRSREQPSGKEPDGGGTGTDFRELPRFDA